MSEPAARTSMIPRRRSSAASPSAEVPWPFDERRSRRSLEPPAPESLAASASEPAPTPSAQAEPAFSPTITLRGLPSPLPPPPEATAVEPRTSVPTLGFYAYEPSSPALTPPAPWVDDSQTSACAQPVEPLVEATVARPLHGGVPRPATAERLTDADAIADDGLEVTLLWTVDADLVETLHVAHLFPPRPFVLGEKKADYVAGPETLGCDRLPIVTIDEAGVWILVPEGAEGELAADGRSRGLDALAERGELAPSGDAPSARRLLLAPGASASITLAGGLTYQVRRVTRPKSLAAFRRRTYDARAIASGVVSLLLNVGLVTAVLLLGVLPPAPPSTAPLAEIRPARLVPRMPEPEEAVTRTQVRSFEGERHRGTEGRAGRPDAPETRRRLGIQGTSRVRQPARADRPPPPAPPTPTPPAIVPPPPTPQRQVLPPSPLPPSPIPTPPARVANMPNWPTSSVATSPVATGPDPRSAQGNLTGAQIGDARGAGGLGLRGTGPGGGGTGSGIGGGRVDMGQWGMDVGVSPVAREQVRRVIRSHLGQIRACYGGASGRVTLRLVVNQSGAVQAVRAQGGGTGDQCAERAVRSWAFPAIPNSGITIVTYPVSLSGQDA